MAACGMLTRGAIPRRAGRGQTVPAGEAPAAPTERAKPRRPVDRPHALAAAGFHGPREAVLLRSPQFQCAHGAPACCNYLR
jgi:hypothetical protein